MPKSKHNNNRTKSDDRSLIKRFKQQSIIVKIFMLVTLLFFAVLVVLNSLTLALGHWKNIGYYSIWVLFSWLFLGVFIYIISKLISVVLHKHHDEQDRLEMQKLSENKNVKRESEKQV